MAVLSATCATYHRIVSLSPSATEIVFALGLGDRLAGVTDSCDFPPEAQRKPHVCAWFDPDLQRIADLRPDLILGLKTAHEALQPELERACPGVRCIWTHAATVDQALEDLTFLGGNLGRSEAAQQLVRDLRERLARVDALVAGVDPARRLTVSRVLEWTGDEVLVAGPLSFQYDVIARAGGRNVTGELREAYPKLPLSVFLERDPEVVFFCGTDPRFVQRLSEHPEWSRFRAVRSGRLYQFNCNLTCRTGPRIVDMVELLYATLYGGSVPPA